MTEQQHEPLQHRHFNQHEAAPRAPKNTSQRACDPEMSATAASVDREGGGAFDVIGESVTFIPARSGLSRRHEDREEGFCTKRFVSFVALRAFVKKLGGITPVLRSKVD
jgi:hypothetical protein